jgi:hypothetical protein
VTPRQVCGTDDRRVVAERADDEVRVDADDIAFVGGAEVSRLLV